MGVTTAWIGYALWLAVGVAGSTLPYRPSWFVWALVAHLPLGLAWIAVSIWSNRSRPRSERRLLWLMVPMTLLAYANLFYGVGFFATHGLIGDAL